MGARVASFGAGNIVKVTTGSATANVPTRFLPVIPASTVMMVSNGASSLSDAVIVHTTTVPEPTTVASLGLSLLGFAAPRHRPGKSRNA